MAALVSAVVGAMTLVVVVVVVVDISHSACWILPLLPARGGCPVHSFRIPFSVTIRASFVSEKIPLMMPSIWAKMASPLCLCTTAMASVLAAGASEKANDVGVLVEPRADGETARPDV